MHPSSLVADLYMQATLPDLAHSALPDAPVQPFVARRWWVRRSGSLEGWRG